ncbi:hypothetical protein TNCV_2491581 [Trichonephila clavipes]|nr:hypothetical protein TNCV_2491581 [Trichonephila clavipes]
MHEQEQQIEEFQYFDPVQQEYQMTVLNLTEGMSLIQRCQDLPIDELIEMYEQEQDIEELQYFDPVQQEYQMTV